MARVPERIASGIYRVDAIGLSNSISVLLIDGDDGWTLVDTGMRASVLRIQEALAALGAGPNELRRIYLTHHHLDHIGGLPAVRWWATEAEVVASDHEARIISGEHPLDPPSNKVFRFCKHSRRRKRQAPRRVEEHQPLTRPPGNVFILVIEVDLAGSWDEAAPLTRHFPDGRAPGGPSGLIRDLDLPFRRVHRQRPVGFAEYLRTSYTPSPLAAVRSDPSAFEQ